MQQLLNTIRDRFREYEPTVNNIYCENTNEWDSLRGLSWDETDNQGNIINYPSDSTESFFRGILYILKKFLNDQDHTKLFIQIPFEELGRIERDQKANYNRLIKVVSYALHMATIEVFTKQTTCQGYENAQIDDIFYTDCDIPAPNSGYTPRPRVWKIVDSNDGGKRPKEQFPDEALFRTTLAREIFNNKIDGTYKLKSLPPNMRQSTIARLSGFVKYMRGIDTVKLDLQYQNALIVSHSFDWRRNCIPVNDSVLFDPVAAVLDYSKVQSSYDILAFIGDNKYLPFQQIINNQIAFGNSKKVIIIGSDIYPNFENTDVCKYSFSYREMFTYFNGDFPEIKIPELKAEWLLNYIQDFWKLLQNYTTLSDLDRKDIVTKAAFPMLGMDFSSITKPDQNDLKKYLLENHGYQLSSQEINDILVFYGTFHIDSISSKKSEYQQILQINSRLGKRSANYLIPNHFNYRDNLKKFLRENSNRSVNRLIVDVKGDWSGFVDVIKYMLKQGVMGTYHLLSYSKLKNIRDFFAKEIDAYNLPYRTQILGRGMNADMNLSEETPNNMADFNLSDFYHPTTLNNLMQNQWSRQLVSVQYKLTLDNTSNIYISGDVIYYDSTIGIDQLYDDRDACLPAMITYYVNPDNFRDLIRYYFNFPNNRDVQYYSNLWKKKLLKYGHDEYADNYKIMRAHDFPFLPSSQILNYLRSNNETMFPNSLPALALRMKEINLIDENEAKNLVAAFNANKRNSSLGAELKAALFNYRLSGGERTPSMLSRIIRNAAANGVTITASSIAETSLFTVVVSDIQKI